MTRFLCATVVLMLAGFASVGNAAGPAHNILTFDVPSATFTYPTGINAAGQVTGYYLDATGQQHGFVRSKGGSITTFDVPGSTGTVPQAISQAGLITGYSNGPINQRGVHSRDVIRGFVRQRDGAISLFDACDVVTSTTTNSSSTRPQDIDPEGEIVGLCHQDVDIDSYNYGFLRHADGTTQAVPFSSFSKQQTSLAVAINPRGQVTGQNFPGAPGCCGQHTSGFLEQPDGSVTLFDAVAGVGSKTLPEAINRAGQITGANCGAADCTSYSGFLRQKDGAIITFTPAGSVVTRPQAINPRGLIAGFYADAGNFYHGFLRESDGAIAAFDVFNSTNTSPTAMNNEGDIAGWYSDASGKVHGFVLRH